MCVQFPALPYLITVCTLAVFPKDSLPLNTQLPFPVRFAGSICQPFKLLHALHLTTLRTLPCSKFIVPFNTSTALDLCTKDKKCKLQHQICKKVKGTYVCDCSEGYYHGFRKCEGNALQFLPTLKNNIRGRFGSQAGWYLQQQEDLYPFTYFRRQKFGVIEKMCSSIFIQIE